MDNSVLYPPNFGAMRDDTVTGVLQTWRPSLSSPTQTPVRLPSLFASETKRSVQVPSRKTTEEAAAAADAQRINQETTKEELRRQRNRVHQARHKMKQQQRVVDLERNIQTLREEIQQLQVQQHTISLGVPGSKSVWCVAAEYFRLFRNGSHEQQAPAAGVLCKVNPHVQRNFLRATVTSNVAGETGYGIDSLMGDWQLIYNMHNDFDVQLVRLEYGVCDSLVATTRVTFSINENTMRIAFPHLMDGVGRELAAKLLGQKLVMHGAVRLEWDGEVRRMTSIQNEADLVTPMLRLLGSLEDVARVFDRARITPEAKFVAS